MPMSLVRKMKPDGGQMPAREKGGTRNWLLPAVVMAVLLALFATLELRCSRSDRGPHQVSTEVVMKPDGHTLLLERVDGSEAPTHDPQCQACRRELDRRIREVVAFAFDSLVVHIAEE